MRPNQPMDMDSLLTAQLIRRVTLSERDERHSKHGEVDMNLLVLLAMLGLAVTLVLLAFVPPVVLPADSVEVQGR